MRMPYQRITTGPTWNAIAPGELMTRGSTERRISRGTEKTGTPDARLLALLGSENFAHDATVSAAIGFDAALEKLRGMLLHDAALPGFADDRALVLSSGSIRWKQQGPGVGVRADDPDRAAAAQPHGMAWTQRRDQARHAIDHLRLPFVSRCF